MLPQLPVEIILLSSSNNSSALQRPSVYPIPVRTQPLIGNLPAYQPAEAQIETGRPADTQVLTDSQTGRTSYKQAN